MWSSLTGNRNDDDDSDADAEKEKEKELAKTITFQDKIINRCVALWSIGLYSLC